MNPVEAAKWMLGEFEKSGGYLDQDVVVYEMQRLFGDDSVYDNEAGNLAINRAVLKEFRRLTETTVVWERSERAWRRRAPYDEPGKRQVE